MKRYFLAVVLASLMMAGQARAVNSPTFQIGGLTGNYYLDRDPQGVSTLTAEEVITVIFPRSGTSFTGFNRTLPAEYLKTSNALKISSVTDVGGQDVHYSTTTDSQHNLVINIGDPTITLYGDQSYTIRYQAKGVINLQTDKQEFYPNFNGRGWNVPFNSLNGIVHLTSGLAGQLINQPTCLIDSGHCEVVQQTKPTETIYVVSAKNSLPAHQSLTAKLDFKPGTFQPYKPASSLAKVPLLAGGGLAVLIILALFRSLFGRSKPSGPNN